ncbi:transporter substrate-binding domain-containing protein [Ancylobacter terrae]|uniref:transporter substrate-binding domain-containing protein n=1 Tax=Ancylobacter sp. sgz301288 TaxID=3342077 RepID=UPI00385B71C0
MRGRSALPILVAGLLCLTLFSPVQARSLQDILSAGEIRIGVNVLIPPRAQMDDRNEIVGFDPDVASAIAQKLGVKLVLVNVNGPERIPFVASDRIDASMGGMTRTSERAKVIDFTVPISGNSYGIITREDTGIATLDDLNQENRTIAMSRGTAVLAAVQARLPKAKFLLLDNIPDRDRTVAQGRADAIVDLIDSTRVAKTYPDVKWRIVATPELAPSFDGIAVAKGNETLRLWLNIAIWELHNSGTILETWQKWFGKPMATPVPVSPFF